MNHILPSFVQFCIFSFSLFSLGWREKMRRNSRKLVVQKMVDCLFYIKGKGFFCKSKNLNLTKLYRMLFQDKSMAYSITC